MTNGVTRKPRPITGSDSKGSTKPTKGSAGTASKGLWKPARESAPAPHRDGFATARHTNARGRRLLDAPPPPTVPTDAATASTSTAAGVASTTPAAPNLAIARKLVRAGGSGTAEDAEVVANRLARLPLTVLQQAEKKHLHVVACRGSITDYATDLKGVAPRGWPPGATWDSVPGQYNPTHKEVIIATHADAHGARIVPPLGDGQGSIDLVAHEFTHGLDYRDVLGVTSKSPEFDKAYEADVPALTANKETYFLQPNGVGREEMFADAMARSVADPEHFKQEYPHLADFEASLARPVT